MVMESNGGKAGKEKVAGNAKIHTEITGCKQVSRRMCYEETLLIPVT
jgi:hypothetical protein